MNLNLRKLRGALVLIVLLPALLADVSFPAGDDDGGFAPLVHGTDLAQFVLVGFDKNTITITEAGEIALSGKPNGYFATKDAYENYILRFDWTYDRPADLKDDAAFDGNSGVLLHIAGPHKVWPTSVEAQLMYRDAGDIFGVAEGKFASTRTPEQRKEARRKAIKPVGEWNSEEIVCRDGTVRTTINGVLIDEGNGATPARGAIAWQSEGRPIRFRNLRIKRQ